MQDKPGILFDQLGAIVEGMGYTLVDAQGATVKGRLQVHCTIYSPSGIGTGDCEKVSRAVQPRLELLYNNQDVALEVSSPGLERRFASLYEFKVFSGKLARVLPEDSEWIRGYIESANEESIVIRTADGQQMQIAPSAVLKAQLVFQEVK